MSLGLALGLFVVGLAVTLLGAEGLVQGASSLAKRLGMSPLLVGLTIVSLGTSAPELAISIAAALRGEADLALGNVVGSNIANILLIIGAGAVIASIAVRKQLVRLDVPIMLIASVAVYAAAYNGLISRWEGGVLLFGVLAYLLILFRFSKEEVLEEEISSLPKSRAWIYLLGGLTGLVIGSQWLVMGAESAAISLGVNKLVVGLTIVAIGTSAPELITTIVAIRKGEQDLAIGNAVGSNILNLLLVLATTAIVSPTGIAVGEGALGFDLPVMIVVAAVLFPIFFRDYRIFRWEGVLFLLSYAAYVTLVVLEAKEHAALNALSTLLSIAAPLVLILIVTLALNGWRKRRLSHSAANEVK